MDNGGKISGLVMIPPIQLVVPPTVDFEDGIGCMVSIAHYLFKHFYVLHMQCMLCTVQCVYVYTGACICIDSALYLNMYMFRETEEFVLPQMISEITGQVNTDIVIDR